MGGAKPGAEWGGALGKKIGRVRQVIYSQVFNQSQDSKFHFLSSPLLGVSGAPPPMCSRSCETQPTGQGEQGRQMISLPFSLLGDLSMALGLLAEGEWSVGRPKLCTPVVAFPGWGRFPYQRF